MIEAKQTHCGQYKRYGDFFRVWNIHTDLPEDEVIKWCFENLYKRVVPTFSEWQTNTRPDAPKSHDMAYYFGGYYTIKKTDGGFEFSVCEPYAD